MWVQRGLCLQTLLSRAIWGGERMATVTSRRLTVRMTHVPATAGKARRHLRSGEHGVRGQYEQHC